MMKGKKPFSDADPLADHTDESSGFDLAGHPEVAPGQPNERDDMAPAATDDMQQTTDPTAEQGWEVNKEVQLREEVRQLNERWLRSQAELENVRRRARRDIEDNARFATQQLLVDLMDVLDNLERALAAGEHSESASLLSGVQIVSEQFLNVLQKHGCQRILTAGEAFDPNLHEAVQMVPSALPPGVVVQEIRSGYRLHDRVIRPAQVIVAAAK
jgi:molecular chaperone GrpE